MIHRHAQIFSTNQFFYGLSIPEPDCMVNVYFKDFFLLDEIGELTKKLLLRYMLSLRAVNRSFL